jgi:large subunit ribosomal protein L23
MATPHQYYDILKKPVLTEKSSKLQEIRNQYTFKVHPKASKNEIRKAVETIFDVRVTKVNVMTMPSKTRRFLGRPGRTAEWKKAVVTLPEGQGIDLV